MTNDILLAEYQDWIGSLATEDVEFITRELDGKLSIQRQLQGSGYILNPNQFVGVLTLPSGRRIESRPKVPVGNVFYMLSVVLDLPFREEPAAFDSFDDLLEFIAAYFAGLVQERIEHGLYRSYIDLEDNLAVVRGRIDFAQDLRENYVLRHRVYCRYTELTWDIPENQIVRQVVHLLAGWGFRPRTRLRLAQLDGALSEVTPTRLAGGAVDRFVYHRLNEDYRQLHQFCRLFLQGASLDEHAGEHQFRAFLIDMNALFERFVTTLLQERAVHPLTVRAQVPTHLDRDGKVRMFPDIVVFRSAVPVLIADCKYKRPDPGEFIHHDLYQVLSYCTAEQVHQGMLIYPMHLIPAEEEIQVRHLPTTIRRMTIDLSASGAEFVVGCREFADRILRSTLIEVEARAS